jgi:hypothetical protein
MAMSIWTRPELLEQIVLWKAAYKAAATGKAYTIDGRSLNRQDLDEIRAQLTYLAGELTALNHGRGPIAIPARPRR